MADRKQFINVSSPDQELMNLLTSHQLAAASDDELREQRISFAYGNALHSEEITKESVRAASEHVRLLP
jgi:hypothetical protein